MDTNEEIIKKIWQEYKSDNIRFCTSGYHGIAPSDPDGNKVSASSFVEEAFTEIDLGDVSELGINIGEKTWGNYMADQEFFAKYCEYRYEQLKQFNCFEFDAPTDDEGWYQFVGENL